jgi:tetratricopeptide (TPR) repeat protein
VGSLLERSLLPAETQQALLERSGGNPLYAEEFVRLLSDRGDLGEDVEVPESVQALIAARLDTLPQDRKSLLQDAAVLGKVFWAGALTEMGERDPRDVEQALHELSRKELVRPARTSSMEEEAEYGFWHVLICDVCYAQIPRAARAARHRAAVTWIERKAAERLEDLADVLAYHCLQALELDRAAGAADTAELKEGSIRYLGLAGERALSLDVERAEAHLAKALELASGDHAERADLLERWAQAVQQQGRLQDARKAFEEAADLHRQQGEMVAAGRALTRLGLVVHRLGDPRAEELLAEALELLEAQPAGQELVSLHAYMAGRLFFTGNYREAVAVADRGLALASELGLPEPAFVLHWRGVPRCQLGEAEGLEDVRRALQLALEQGLGRETAVIYGNLAGVTGLYQGPQANLDVSEETIAFCEQRGITEIALQNRSAIPTLLAELGRTEQALAEAGPIADRIQMAGDMSWLEPRGLQLRLLAETGMAEHAPDPEPLLAAAREIDLFDFIALAYAAATQLLLALGQREQAHALLEELDQLGRAAAEPSSGLPSVLRTALALEDQPLAQRLTERIEPITPWHEYALASAQAQLAEAAGDRAAAELYKEAADRWHGFGNVPELAYALLGQGRCLASLGRPEAEEPLREAKELFTSMGYKPALAETDALLAETAAAAS